MFDITESQREARGRLDRTSKRRRRSDAGRSRLPAAVLAELRAAALGPERPSMGALQRQIAAACATKGLRPPARASLYNSFSAIDGHSYSVAALPPAVVEALYNLPPTGTVPGHQLAFYCLNYGSLAAVSYAASLSWLDLYQARRLRGWRPRSRGLLAAITHVRGIR
jgi:hypothetical protein